MKKWRDEFVCSMWLNINEDVGYEKNTNHTNVIELEIHLKIFIRKKDENVRTNLNKRKPHLRLPGHRNIKA
jgi:hypothetical protein